MLDKTDKCFLISLIIVIASVVSTILLIIVSIEYNIEFLFLIVFMFFVVNYIFLFPIFLITQIITFIIKIFSKNKCKKDWLIILSNLISILFFGYIYLALTLIAITL